MKANRQQQMFYLRESEAAATKRVGEISLFVCVKMVNHHICKK
ncbi:hypothetical protein [Lysinibacillus sp. G4S2]|nr:hypothetical protein [Lysinibacillus sp. G4S2]MDM5250236.1 hypothetical protein [Lysinibacillus sp. G4S2]